MKTNIENLFLNYLSGSINNLQKHQQHDQSSHGNWASSGTYPTQDNVSDFMYDSVYSYTNRGYKYLNWTLRNNMQYFKSDVDGMDAVIEQTPALTENKTLLRGVTGGIANQLLESQVGTTFRDKGYMSTTGNINVAKFFSSNQSDDYAIMVLDVPKGMKAFQPRKFFIGQDDGSDLWGALNAEDEYILPRGTKFQVTGVDKDTRTINVKVIT